jgi:hypothetical protein
MDCASGTTCRQPGARMGPPLPTCRRLSPIRLAPNPTRRTTQPIPRGRPGSTAHDASPRATWCRSLSTTISIRPTATCRNLERVPSPRSPTQWATSCPASSLCRRRGRRFTSRRCSPTRRTRPTGTWCPAPTVGMRPTMRPRRPPTKAATTRAAILLRVL